MAELTIFRLVSRISRENQVIINVELKCEFNPMWATPLQPAFPKHYCLFRLNESHVLQELLRFKIEAAAQGKILTCAKFTDLA